MPGARPPKTSTIDFAFPDKGWNTAGPLMDQPSGTSRDLLNVRPFVGATDRGRGGQRAGLVKATATRLGSATTSVQQLAQITLGGAATTLLSDTWGYSAGVLSAVSGGKWSALGAGPDEFKAVGDGTVTLNALTGVHNTLTGNECLQRFASLSLNFVATIPLALVASTNSGFGDQVDFLACFGRGGSAGDQLFTVNIQHFAAATNQLFVSITGFWGSNNFTATDTSASGTWTIQYTNDGVTATVIVQRNGVTVCTSSGAAGNAVDGDDHVDSFWMKNQLVQHTGTATYSITGPLQIVNGAPTQRTVKLIALANGLLYGATEPAGLGASSLASSLSTITAGGGGGAGIAAASYGGKLYLLDGNHSKVYDVAAGTIADWIPTKGLLPAGCRIACTWGGRVAIANQQGDEQNIFFSREGDPLDFDYAPVVPDVGMAVALNASTAAGHIGQPVYAMVAFNDDVMLIGCDGSIFLMTGDPAGGGRITTLSDAIGVFSMNSWCQAPDGTVYFVGTGGFYACGAGGQLQNLSQQAVPQFFTAIDRSSTTVTCVWDVDRHGCWIFCTPHSGATPGTHLWFDQRTGGFFPASFGAAGSDPLCALAFDGDGPSDRVTLLGCKDGYVRSFSTAALDDDGTAISSYCLLGPVQPFGTFRDAAVQRVESVFGDDTTGATLALLIAKDAPTAGTAAAQSIGGTFSGGGRQTPVLTRYRGNTFYLKVAAAAGPPAHFWSLEMLQALASDAGMQR